MQMDWKALGYERVWVDGKIRWVPQESQQTRKD